MTTRSSSRRPLIAGNWKMNMSLAETVALASALAKGLPGGDFLPEIMVAPPFTALAVAAEALKGGPILLAGQDMCWEASGAFTGEVSAGQLLDAGCRGVILGHSERRRLFGETDELVRRKLKAALKAGLTPIACVGELLEEREAGRTLAVLETQARGCLKDLPAAELGPLVIAYEPVWAIGTGKTASPEQAQEAHKFIRWQLASLHGEAFSQAVRILYGGSVTPENVDGLMAMPDVDGALVGGASLKAAPFLRIIGFKA